MNAAFRVWGKDFYQTTSLTPVAEALGVTKPALYRHFKNKEVLFKAMRAAHFDRFVHYIKNDYDMCMNISSMMERIIMLTLSMAGCFLNNREDFIFLFTRIYSCEDDSKTWLQELKQRGIDVSVLTQAGKTEKYPRAFQLTSATAFFMICFYYKQHDELQIDDIMLPARYLTMIDALIRQGISFPAAQIDMMDFTRLEHAVEGCPFGEAETSVHEKLLSVVAEAVAEAGPFGVSMDMVAKKMGFSKSSLYAHFPNKAGMVKEYIITEIKRVAAYAERCTLLSDLAHEQLYLAIIGIAQYLRTNPNILRTIDKLRLQKPEFKKHRVKKMNPVAQIHAIFSQIKTENGACMINERDTEWILFLIVNLLLHRPKKLRYSDVSNESFRILFQFIAGGIKE